ncbi:integumentary mucin A.1-like [Anopheles darlingi]|uniref:integumentary mucin A.1-like n=1 Tax=Anopheles darlingi TaxID=43151 RepID=UPI00210028E6|nr:integumentary mucin A.1-like [Anopheles darlingi]
MVMRAIWTEVLRWSVTEDVTDSESDVESADSADAVEQHGTNQSGSNRVGRIYSGVPATSVNQPYAALIVANSDSGVSQLAGAIINNTQVLTSASGLLSLGNITSMFLYAGSSPSVRAAKYYYEKSYALHSGYDASTLANDVAIITIDGTFAGQTNVKPIPISTTEIAVSTTSRTNCVVLGYGQNTDGSNNNILFQADYELITDQECASLGVKPSSILCARSVKGYACDFDGGAPLVCNSKLYGILTAQTDCTPSSTAKIQKFAKLPVISIPWNPATLSTPSTTLSTPTTTVPTTSTTVPTTTTTVPTTSTTVPTTSTTVPTTTTTVPTTSTTVPTTTTTVPTITTTVPTTSTTVPTTTTTVPTTTTIQTTPTTAPSRKNYLSCA